MCVKKSQVEIATVTMLRISSPNEELNPKTKGDAYKFGLKSQPFIIVAGNSISRHTNLTNHRERILTAVGIQSFRIRAIHIVPAYARKILPKAKQIPINIE
jgi:hypothetical protein